LASAAWVVDERGYARATVAQITARSRVSRRTFYELFENVEDCLCAVVRDILERIERELDPAGLAGLVWRERVRLGLWRILCFFDAQPMLARVLVVHSLQGGPALAVERERALARLVAAVDEGRREKTRAGGFSALNAEAVVGATLAIVAARLTRREYTGSSLREQAESSRRGYAESSRREHTESLCRLLGELHAIVVLPYLGAAVARREQARALPPVPQVAAAALSGGSQSHALPGVGGQALAGVPMRLTYRTARVLESIGAHSGASNRQVADLAGISDQGQVSKLLRRLQRLGLLANDGHGAHTKGEPNAWVLTRQGEQVTHSFRGHTTTTQERAF
jgi:AcrR family transcriptional regulator